MEDPGVAYINTGSTEYKLATNKTAVMAGNTGRTLSWPYL